MRQQNQIGTINWSIHECITCHTLYAMPEMVDNRLKESHESFSCPFGHTQFYPSKNQSEVLQEQVVTLENQLNQCHNLTEQYDDELHKLKNRNRGLKISNTKLRKKIKP